MKSLILVFAAVASAALFSGCKLTRLGYESAQYRVIRKSGPFEIRDYQPLTLVSTPMDSVEPTEGDSFMRLFRYISGANESEQKIAMTTPVFMNPAGTNRQMSFVVPENVASKGTPKSERSDIRVEMRSGGRFAVYRYSGSWDTDRADAVRKKLADWISAERLEPVGEAELANYDPPFTPSFLRRNEVMVRLKENKRSKEE